MTYFYDPSPSTTDPVGYTLEVSRQGAPRKKAIITQYTGSLNFNSYVTSQTSCNPVGQSPYGPYQLGALVFEYSYP